MVFVGVNKLFVCLVEEEEERREREKEKRLVMESVG